MLVNGPKRMLYYVLVAAQLVCGVRMSNYHAHGVGNINAGYLLEISTVS